MCEDLGHVTELQAATPRAAEGPAVDPIVLAPVDEVTVTTLVDNTFDALLVTEGDVVRPPMGTGVVAAPLNIARHAMRLTGVERVAAIIGGFHLSGPAFEPIIGPTIAALVEMGLALVVPGHCTGWRAQHALAQALPNAWAQSSAGSSYHLRAA